MMISDAERERIAEAAKRGTRAPTGPVLERFDALPLAAALEQEAERALLYGKLTNMPGKVDVHLDPRDALMLAQFLRLHGGK